MRELKINGMYRHFKGNMYEVVGVAFDSETTEEIVIYKRVNGDGALWVRNKKMFLSEVDHEKYPNIEQKYRFELIE